jgi:RNA polymerase sigma factor (sigma-70 family)
VIVLWSYNARHFEEAVLTLVLLTPEQQRLLAERIRARDPSAEEELVRLFSARIAMMARARLRDAEVARDVTQDVLFAVIRALRQGQVREAERLSGFVYGTARNLINNHLRTRSRLPAEDPLDDQAVALDMPDLVEDAERGSLVKLALVDLDETSRTILLLTLVEDLKPGDIAARLGLSAEVVRARKSRALRQVTERVKKLSRI